MATTTTHLSKYLIFNHDAQRTAVRELNIHTVYDLFLAVWIDSKHLPQRSTRLYVLKGRLMRYLNKACRKSFLDLHALRRDGLIEFGGKYPDQYIGLIVANDAPPPSAPKAAMAKHVPRHSPIVMETVIDENCGLSDEDALARAVRESLILTKPSPPEELCCPITLEPFRDPVLTIRGQTYERRAIVDWLRKSATDPITGCSLKITTVWPDEEMLARVTAYYTE